MAKYRINGKFVSFKTFVKSNGLDAVVYNQLNDHEKRVYRGLETYEKRAIIKGKFAPHTLTENPTLKAFARSRGETIKQYIEENLTEINKFMKSGLFNRSVNSNSIHDFINKHKGDIIYKGKKISKDDFLFLMDMQRGKDMSTGTTVETIYNFDVKNSGKTLELKSKKLIKSPKKKKNVSTNIPKRSGRRKK